MRTNLSCTGIALTFVLGCFAMPAFSANRLVNMMPNNVSGETSQDAEPTLTVDPNNFSRMAGSAFTWDNLSGSAMLTNTAPIYVSTDRGNTWTLAFIVPSKQGSFFPTGDITLSFSATASNGAHPSSWLYGGTLSATTGTLPMTALRAQDPFAMTVMTTLDTRTGNVDQPHTISKTAGTGQDKLYIGFNNGWGCGAPSGRTSTLDVSQDAAIANPTMTLDLIEARDTACQDGFAQVAAPHKDGTVYAAFLHDFSGSPRLVVVRDDNWGQGVPPFSALSDPSDTKSGVFVTKALTLPSGTMGQNRLGASNVSIAVDPNSSDRVYVAWGDSNGLNSETIHVRRSVNRGVSWSGDLLAVKSAMNPEIAIDDLGVVGVLYQSVVGGKWQTRLARSTDFDATKFDAGILLASQSASTPIATYSPYIGDYASLVTAGTNFVGMFSASNFPDKANFMSGVKFQREVDWTTHKLYAGVPHTTEVPPSIDPFFFEIETNICNKGSLICDICKTHPWICYAVSYDPFWRFKCPMCGINILVDPGDEITRVIVYDSLGKQVGTLQRLREPVVEKGVTYNYAIKLTPKEGVGYVLKAEVVDVKRLQERGFKPTYAVQRIEAKTQSQQ